MRTTTIVLLTLSIHLIAGCGQFASMIAGDNAVPEADASGIVHATPGVDLARLLATKPNGIELAPGVYHTGKMAIQASCRIFAADPDRPPVINLSEGHSTLIESRTPNVVLDLEDLVLDAHYRGRAILCRGPGGRISVRRCTIRRCASHAIDATRQAVLVAEDNYVHHCLGWRKDRGRVDAHAFVTLSTTDVVLRGNRVNWVSGDAWQNDRGTGVSTVLLENEDYRNDPLDEDVFGFKKGERIGENAIDTKQGGTSPRLSQLTIVGCRFDGWRSDYIRNAAAVNVKERFNVTARDVQITNSTIGWRIRGMSKKQALGSVRIDNSSCDESVDVAIRLEDNVDQVTIDRFTSRSRKHIVNANWKPRRVGVPAEDWVHITNSRFKGSLPRIALARLGNEVQ